MENFCCQKETHNFNKILGICFNSKCPESVPQFCLKCIMESHKECQTDCHQFSQMNEVFQLIVENFGEQEIQLDSEFEIVKKKYEAKKKELLMKKGEFIQFQESDRNQDFHIITSRIPMIKQEYNKLKSENFNINIIKGIRLIKNKKWKEATDALNVGVQDKYYELAQFFKSLSLAQMNQFSESQKYIERPELLTQSLVNNLQNLCDQQIQKELENWIVFIIQGMILIYKNEFQKSIEYFDKALELDGQNMYCLYLKCVALVKLKNNSQATQIFGLMKQINLNYYLLYIIEGYVLFSQLKIQQALDCYDKAKSIQEQYSSAHLYGGKCLLYLDRNQEAQKYFERVTDLDRKNAKAFFLLGNSLFRMEKVEESMSCYDLAIEIDNNYLHAKLNKGISLTKLSKYQQADEIYDNLIELDPKFSRAYSEKGCNLLKQQKFKEALIYFDEALKLNYIDVPSLRNKGLCLFKINEYVQAAEAYQTAIEIDPGDQESHYHLGICLKNLKRFSESISSFEKLQQLDKSFQKVHYYKGCSYYQLGKYKDAILCFEQAIEQDKKHYHAYLSLGNCLKKMNKLYDAMVYYDQVIWMEPTIFQSYIYKGNTLRKQLNFKEAISHYNEAIIYYNEANKVNNKLENKVSSKLKNKDEHLSYLIKLLLQKQTEQDNQDQNYLIIIYYKMGQCLFSLKEYDKAQDSFKSAFQVDCQNLNALNFQGFSLCLQNKIQQGLDCFYQSFKLNPKNPLTIFLKEYYENMPSFNGEKIKNQIQSILPKQNQSEELEVQYFIFCEVIDSVETMNEDFLEQIVLILKKMKKLLE